MLPAESAARVTRLDRACLAAAFALPVLWFFIFNSARPDYLVDEPGHLGNIYHFLEGKPGWPEQMTMLPGYHFTVAALWQLHPPFSLLTLARLVPTLSALLALTAFATAWRRLHRSAPATPLASAGPATLLFSLLPILQPFTALAYTDVPAIAFALLGVALHLHGRSALAAVAFVPALLIRQTNLLWPAWIVAHEFLRSDLPRRDFFNRTRWLNALLVLSILAVGFFFFTAGRLTPGTNTGNDLGFNPATLHFAALLTFLLGLPVWLTEGRTLLQPFFTPLRFRLLVPLTAAALGLAWWFKNAHPWNRDLFWDGCTFTLLRNWPLVWLDAHLCLRLVSGVTVTLLLAALPVLLHRSRHPTQLLLAFLFGAVLPFTNTLVEPRYLIPVATFALLFLDLAPALTRRLTLWWFLLCAVHAPFIARGLSLW